jgi:hypothetical protein
MLKRFVVAAAFVAIAGAVHAQPMDDEDMGDDSPMQGMSSHQIHGWADDEDQGGGRRMRDRGEGRGGWSEGRGGWSEDADRGGAGPGGQGLRRMMMMRRMVERMSPGAAFRIRSGDQVVAVRCPRDESMKACIDATTTLIERLRGMRTGSGGSAMPGSGPQLVPRENLAPDGSQGTAPKP